MATVNPSLVGNLPLKVSQDAVGNDILEASVALRTDTSTNIGALAGFGNELVVASDTGDLFLLNGTPGGAKRLGASGLSARGGMRYLAPTATITGVTPSATSRSILMAGGSVSGDLTLTKAMSSSAIVAGNSVAVSDATWVSGIAGDVSGAQSATSFVGAVDDYNAGSFRLCIPSLRASYPGVDAGDNFQGVVLRAQTTNATPTFLDAVAESAGNLGMATRPFSRLDIVVMGTTAANKLVAFHRRVWCTDSGPLGAVETVGADYKDASLAACTVAIVVSNLVQVQVTGLAGTSIKWSAMVYGVSFGQLGP